MRVTCTKILNPFGTPVSASVWLTVGSTYTVISMAAIPGKEVKFRVIDDTGASGLWGSEMFVSVSTSIPSNWVVGLDDRGIVTLAPESWLSLGFWERFYDDDESAREQYDVELTKIQEEALL
jgi:hypothetical protein